ncbi:PVC-type heme-binding CxxCH protein [Novipirellula caenicola]|uniref:Cytochrome c domain-containing protein n=1 Tax=Novipirellula caenicola TaxID=1536901 RepID=A0ABP9VUR6_9BACT
MPIRYRFSQTLAFTAFFLSIAVLGPACFAESIQLRDGQRVALVGNSTAERMNLFGNLETRFQLRTHDQRIQFRNFGWPADEVANQQRPGNYTLIDDPFKVYGGDFFLCFFGFNESFAGDSPEAIETFVSDYRKYLSKLTTDFTVDGRKPTFVLVTPIAFESTGKRLHADADLRNAVLSKYAAAIRAFGKSDGYRVVDVFEATEKLFSAEPGAQYTINGIHLNEQGDEELARLIDAQLFDEPLPSVDPARKEKLRTAINDKSWLHSQDYRMLNGWYVYGGRRTWDTETFPTEFRKIRQMVDVRDSYVWDIAAGRPVADNPDDSGTGEVFTPETMFGSRDENFRKMREPTTLEYPTPEESISQMNVPEDFRIELFASEREFPELANPTQIAFDEKGRLWVSCMVNYPQWLPGSSRPSDRLLILEDTDGDGKADKCTTFYDKLICPTGFEFYDGGVLVVDEPRIIHLKDTDGDDKADEVVHVLDGLATDDTHHTMGAWEFSHGGLLYMQEGVSMSTTLETPWGPFRNHGPSGSYVWDLESLKIRHFRTPAYGNPWCLVFDKWGMGVIGDGTGAQQHWASLLSGAAVRSRSSVQPIFNNEGMRPAVGSEFLTSRHFPESYHDHFIYACVINMHGMPKFTIEDEPGTAGLTGKRIEDLLSSTDMFFRPVDPKVGPDGAVWFGDWCNALIGHMQYSQRDPNRDHEHGRIYRMVYNKKPLIEPVLQAGKSVEELLDQLDTYELRTRYRVRRALHDRDENEVLTKAAAWLGDSTDPMKMCEVLWLQEFFHRVDSELVNRIMNSDDFHARSAAIHVVGNQWEWMDNPNEILRGSIVDAHPRVRLETLRAISFQETIEAVEIALRIDENPRDQWIDYVFEHTLQALQPVWEQATKDPEYLASLSPESQKVLRDYQHSTGPGRDIYVPLRTLMNPDKKTDHNKALEKLVAAGGGNIQNGAKVFERTCAACHLHGELGKEFGPKLTDVGSRMSREQIIRSVIWPNEEISKGFETVQILTYDGQPFAGFILAEDEDTLTLGIANGKIEKIDKEEIEIRKEMKASSMPEGLLETISPGEFLDLIVFLTDGWISTDPNRKMKLRKYGEFEEISRDAQLKLGADFQSRYSGGASSFMSGKSPTEFDFAFHSREGAKPEDTMMVIRLASPSEVRHVELTNRRSAQFHSRAKGLAMWASNDGQSWTKVWTSEQPQAKYSFDLLAGTQAQFIKLGLENGGTFHLDQAVFYGRRLPASGAVSQK